MTVPQTAVALAAAVRGGTVTPQEAVAASLDRIADLDAGPHGLHAFATVRAEAARAEAEAVAARADLASLPLAGVPVAVKDLVPVQGEPMLAGSLAGDPGPQPHDHLLVTRLRDAGAVVVGSTLMPEAALWAATDVPGAISRNPWDRTVTSGGSSGGSAAAVAAGMVPLAHAADGLGSIRIPSAVCGVVGVKPGSGVVLPHDTSPENWYGLTSQGAIAATVADAALLTSVLADRPDLAGAGDPAADVGGLRVGVSVASPLQGVRVARDVVAAVFGVAGALRRAGAAVDRVHVPYPTWMALAGTARWFAVAVPTLDAATDPASVQPRTRTHARIGRLTRRYVREADAQAWRELALGVFEHCDVLLKPVLATAPMPALAWSRRSWAANAAASLRCSGGLTPPWNLAGFPTVAVPAGRHGRTGVPIGVQLVGPPGSEARLLQVAAAVERERPWPRHAPAPLR